MAYAFLSLVGLFAILSLQGCSILVSDAKYEAEKEMWKAKAAASIAQANVVRPLATFTTANHETFTVMNPNQPAPMPVTGEPNAMVQALDIGLNSWAVKMFGGGYLADKIFSNMQGNYSAGDGSSIDVTRDSGNTVDVTTRHTEGDSSGIAEEQHDASDISNTDNRSDYDNATETPTVVNQSDPVIITQPEPIVVTQPAPVIVDPVVVHADTTAE